MADNYYINEIFLSVQGEGAYVGTPSLFVRFSGCNLKCEWCDSKNALDSKNSKRLSLDDLVRVIAIERETCKRIIFTGGEPTLQLDDELLRALLDYAPNLIFAIETNGTGRVSPLVHWVTVSPKRGTEIFMKTLERADELKFIVDSEFTMGETAVAALVSRGHEGQVPAIKYLQPQWDDPTSLKKTMDLVLQHPDWRLSLQTHKYINVR